VGVGVGDVGAAGGGGPGEVAGAGLVECPAGVLFELVVPAAGAAEVAVAGGAAVFPGAGVVEVGALGGLAAGGVAAGDVAGGDVFAQPGRGLVGVGAGVVGAPAGVGVGPGLGERSL
jgi:hypothetical protein